MSIFASKSHTIAGLVLPSGYAYVLTTIVAALWITFLMGMKVSGYRKAAQVPYPYQYVERAEAEKNPKAHVFNCAQRVHLNTLESLPSFIFLTLFNGLFFPKAATALSATWVISRIPYAIGYYSGVPKRRAVGGIFSGLSFIGMLITATYASCIAIGAVKA